MTILAVIGEFIGAVVVIIILCLFINDAVENRSPSNLGKAGESNVSSILSSLPQEYLVFNNVTIPDQLTDPSKKHTTQIDHVVVSPFGIFVIETKNYSGWIFGGEKSKRWKETFKTTSARYFYNPIKQNWGHAYALAEHFHLNISVFKPIVVFSNKCQLHVNTTTPVVYMSQLEGLIRSYTQEILSRAEVVQVFNRLCEIRLVGEEIEDQHVQSIRQRYVEKETSSQRGKCPRCGGNLIMRNGKYGAFFGCSNYPKCRFTQNLPS